jgi:hypothetical protein
MVKGFSTMYRLKLRIRFVVSDRIASPENVVSGSLRRLRRRAGLIRPAVGTLFRANF